MWSPFASWFQKPSKYVKDLRKSKSEVQEKEAQAQSPEKLGKQTLAADPVFLILWIKRILVSGGEQINMVLPNAHDMFLVKLKQTILSLAYSKWIRMQLK